MAIKCTKCQADNPETSRYCAECGTQMRIDEKSPVSFTKTIQAPPKELSKGATIAGRYEIVDELGRGGMGVVYKAEDTKLKRTVALKFLSPELTCDPDAKKRFLREAQAAAALDHPNICTVHEIEETDERTFISMAYIEGKSLKQKVRQGPLMPEEAIRIAIQVAEGLEEAHKRGIIHRDIKSSNIMVTAKGQVKITDFGLAKMQEGALVTKEGTTMGTLAYMSPEQIRSEVVDHRTDLWSLGVVLYEILISKLPFQGDCEAAILFSIVNDEPKPLKKTLADLPSGLQPFIDKALEKKPEIRYLSAREMLEDLKQVQEELRTPEEGITDLKSLFRLIRKPVIVGPLIIVLVGLIVASVWFVNRRAKIKWARNQALPEIIRLVEEENFIAAFRLAKQAEKHISEDPLLSQIWPQISRDVSFHTVPEGADVYLKNYKAIETDWDYLGQTPLENVRIPRGFFRWRVEKEEYKEVELAASGPQGEHPLPLDKSGTIPSEMVRVLGDSTGLGVLFGWDAFRIELDDFLMDKYEVTNGQFKEFLDSGGYRNPEFWKHEFMKDGKILNWEEAIAEFQDSTGRTGPANWELGAFPEGQENYPVSGISWYEAAAFAEFVGKSLPTVFHWFMAANCSMSSEILPLSNFGDIGPAPVGEYQGLSSYGTYDMAGNVREWCLNACGDDRFIRGGAWSDPTYMFSHTNAKSPFDRSLTNGFRCIKYLTSGSILEKAEEPIPIPPLRDYTKENPVSDEVYRIYESLYHYDKAETEPKIEFTDESPKYWIKQKIFYRAVSRDERMFAYLFLPKGYPSPYQTLIIFPGASAFDRRSSGEGETLWSWYTTDLIIRSGRAVLYPIFKSAFERGDGYSVYDPETTTSDHRDRILIWRKELGRSIDYLETRSDIDCKRLCYYGSSFGSIMGTIYLALEERFKTGILRLGGLPTWDLPSEVDPINFVPRIKIPILMLNGKYDYLFPYEISQRPLLHFLGTPEEHKLLKAFPTDHSLSGHTKEVVKFVLDWLDRYLGPVNNGE